ncbi:GlcG/HbpS family heme-binding protein [Mangrovicoccus algicola]|uniref:Heme-binding protein n=1 Tax=Mangrovicoccus algicola TaxID=2771008 RepID=A0A8J7CHH8_9RHOB|nr:heme-binding protein [Mangrovicoccus algicola]MBE3638175.1 heme-binding protein [Mangrovicoccus algicola]
MKTALKLQPADARVMVEAAIAKSGEMGVAETICIADEGGFPLIIERMEGARVTGPQIAWNKAFTAATHKRSTHLFNKAPNGPALPGNEAFGIQLSFEGRFAVFVGGFPIVVDGEVIGGVGLSGGNGEQDIAAGVAALQALADLLEDSGHEVIVAADIKK